MTVCSRPEDGLRCRQGENPPLKLKLQGDQKKGHKLLLCHKLHDSHVTCLCCALHNHQISSAVPCVSRDVIPCTSIYDAVFSYALVKSSSTDPRHLINIIRSILFLTYTLFSIAWISRLVSIPRRLYRRSFLSSWIAKGRIRKIIG